MTKILGAGIVALCIVFSGCVQSEDRRWRALSDPQTALPETFWPTVSVYSFAPPLSPSAKTRLRDLASGGQRALIEAIAAGADPSSLRQKLAPNLEPSASRLVDRTRLSRTLVISVRRSNAMPIGDRLMRTVISVKPHAKLFEFTDYSVVATDNRVLSIAHLEDENAKSLDVALEPTIAHFGDIKVDGKVSRDQKASADISQQYENLDVEILPGELTITRESERGLDVVGNTLVALTLSLPPDALPPSPYTVASAQTLFANEKALPAAKAKMTLAPLRFLPQCDLVADVTMHFVLRHVDKGQRYYTEGKQHVSIIKGDTPIKQHVIVRGVDVQAPVYQVQVAMPGGLTNVVARSIDGSSKVLVFEDYDAAQAFARWLHGGYGSVIGEGDITLTAGAVPLPQRPKTKVDRVTFECPSQPTS